MDRLMTMLSFRCPDCPAQSTSGVEYSQVMDVCRAYYRESGQSSKRLLSTPFCPLPISREWVSITDVESPTAVKIGGACRVLVQVCADMVDLAGAVQMPVFARPNGNLVLMAEEVCVIPH
jgi:hypothetical protein